MSLPCTRSGTLHILTLAKRQGGSRASKWTEEKRLRVWTPPGFDAANPPPGGYPVLYMNDGQNMFEVGAATAAKVSSEGQLGSCSQHGAEETGSARAQRPSKALSEHRRLLTGLQSLSPCPPTINNSCAEETREPVLPSLPMFPTHQ